MPDGVVPVPPDKIRPGQLAVVMLGRVIIGDIAATLVDLAVRGMLAVEQSGAEGQTGWVLSGHATASQSGSLLPYEKRLFEAVTADGEPTTLNSLTPGMQNVLNAVREAIVHDAVSRGWLHRFHHDQRTEAAEQLALRIRSFQRDLRKFASSQGQADLNGRLLPYALHFGMVHDDQVPLARFAHSWVTEFAGVPGWHEPPAARRDMAGSDEVAKPTIDEQIMDRDVGAMLWVTGGTI